MKHTRKKLMEVSENFQINGSCEDIYPYGTGHINDTYASKWTMDGRESMFILQRINTKVFNDPLSLMRNIRNVTTHLQDKLANTPGADPEREALTLIPTKQGEYYLADGEGDYWRTYIFIRNALTHDVCAGEHHAFEAARMFGKFQMLLSDIPENSLTETIPWFHHTPKRVLALKDAIEKDPCNRCKNARQDIDFVMARENITSTITGLLEKNIIPTRVTHNDTKINNVMMDDTTGDGICVIDLDTVMPGSVLYDFGDMVRSTARTAQEDEQDLSKVEMNMKIFEALVNGYMRSAGHFLTSSEKEHLAFSGILITLTIGIRFLTDYLLGDTYFKIHREGHNIDRARVQFKMIESMESQFDNMNKIVANL